MPVKKEPDDVVTKTGKTVKLNYCRKCMDMIPAKEFYDCSDNGFVDANGLFSVCKKCVQDLYDLVFKETNSMEKSIHKLCTSLNVKFSNEAVSATKAHIQTLMDSGKNVNAIFSIYKMKLTATNKSMDKSALEDQTYDDVGTIFTSESIDTKEIAIPKETIDFWGKDLTKGDVEFLEKEYTDLKSTHKANTRAEVILLKQVCFCLLDIKKLRLAGDDTGKLVKELQDLLKNLAISPNIANANTNASKADESFGIWIQDIEQEEPAQWLKTDPRGDLYRDIGNTDDYFQKYIVRPLKNFIMNSRDFNVDNDDDTIDDISLPSEAPTEYPGIDAKENEV